MPRVVTEDDVAAVRACSDGVALGIMLGAARSYWASAGGVVLGACAAGSFALLAMPWFAVASLAGLAGAAMVTIEARRRARQWEGLIEGRLAQLAAAR